MTAVRVLLYAALTLGSGAATVGLVRLPLRLGERLAMTPVIGIVGGTALSAVLALGVGVTTAAALGGPLLLGLLATAGAWFTGDPRTPWRESWADERARWAERRPWGLIAVMVMAAVFFIVLFGRGIVEQGGGISAGYSTVWSDWAHHHTRAASFAVAHNLPPSDPLFAGSALRYPFLPDFHTAMLEVLGVGPGLAYALPGIALCLCITLLVVSLAVRLGAPAGAGVIAVAACFVGGGLGFVGAVSDACVHHGYPPDHCSLAHLVRTPVDALPVVAGTLHDLPGVVAAQPRAYDGLQTDPASQPLPNMQWYTPVLAWWLPQTSIAYGFATAMVILLLAAAGTRESGRQWPTFAVGGGLVGLLPWVHVHTLIALALVLLAFAMRWRRREWMLGAGIAAVLGGPRLLQLSLGPHGSAVANNYFPWVEPGWMWDAQAAASGSHSPAGIGALLAPLVSPRYWEFWVVNLGIAVPLCLAVTLGMLARRGPPALARVGARLTRPFSPDLLTFCAPFMLVFLISNYVVFQSWDWDNTKVLVYWYLAAALLAGSLVMHWLRRGTDGDRVVRRWRPAAAVAVLATMLGSGVLVLLRFLPWTPAEDSVAGPYPIARPVDRALASAIAQRTPASAVFLTPGRPQDPVLTLAGRSSVMGYEGWLWSYGVDFGSRIEDVHTLYRGCAEAPAGGCRVDQLLDRYHVHYVEVDRRLTDTGVLESGTDLTWWAAQRYPIVARNEDIVVYDVGRR